MTVSIFGDCRTSRNVDPHAKYAQIVQDVRQDVAK